MRGGCWRGGAQCVRLGEEAAGCKNVLSLLGADVLREVHPHERTQTDLRK